MKIHIASLCLRFYKRDGWTHKKVQSLLVDKTRRVSYRKAISDFSSYYAVYQNGFNSGKNIQFIEAILNHEIEKSSFIGDHEIYGYLKGDE